MSLRRVSPIPAIIILGVIWAYREYLPYIVGAVAVVIAIVFAIKMLRAIIRMTRNAHFRDIDQMDGLEFEEFVAQVLKANGYHHVKLTKIYDYGIDILARKDGIRWGIQVKRNTGQVKVEAVRQAVTGLRMYTCDRAMVITNSYLGRYATTLARVNDCVLIDRPKLHRLMR